MSQEVANLSYQYKTTDKRCMDPGPYTSVYNTLLYIPNQLSRHSVTQMLIMILCVNNKCFGMVGTAQGGSEGKKL
jgi:hypothetical protein